MFPRGVQQPKPINANSTVCCIHQTRLLVTESHKNVTEAEKFD